MSNAVREQVLTRLRAMAEHSMGSSTRVVRALILAAPPSMSDGELTAKGSINNRKVLTLRKDFVERLYNNDDAAVVHL